MATTGIIVVTPKAGRIGVRIEARHVETGEWVEIAPLTEAPDDIECHLGHFEGVPDGANIRLIFEEMP